MSGRIADADDARRLLRGYERGIDTRNEVVSRLIQAAASCPAAMLAEVLTPEWLDLSREQTTCPRPERAPAWPSWVFW